MAPFIESVLDQVKGDLAEALSVEKIEQICRELNYTAGVSAFWIPRPPFMPS